MKKDAPQIPTPMDVTPEVLTAGEFASIFIRNVPEDAAPVVIEIITSDGERQDLTLSLDKGVASGDWEVPEGLSAVAFQRGEAWHVAAISQPSTHWRQNVGLSFDGLLVAITGLSLVAGFYGRRSFGRLRSIRTIQYVLKRDRACSVLLLGRGGAGKTTLARALLGQPNQKQLRTQSLVTYSQAFADFPEHRESPSLTWLCATDYRGQAGIPSKSELDEYSKSASLAGQPPIMPFVAAVLVVDVVAEPRSGHAPSSGVGYVREQARYWNLDNLMQIFKRLPASFGGFALFINKLDLVDRRSDKERYRAAFEELRGSLRAFSEQRGFDLQVFSGSALTGAGVPELRIWLLQFASRKAID